MMFASKTPSDLNHDPHPWREPDGSRVATWAETRINGGARRVPRPEFDHVQHNPVNPALAMARMGYGSAGFDSTSDWARSWMLALRNEARRRDSKYSPEEITHARAVLARLARLAEKES